MTNQEIVIKTLQAALSKFEGDRDQAISNINGLMEIAETTEDGVSSVTEAVANNFKQLALAKINISSILEEFRNIKRIE